MAAYGRVTLNRGGRNSRFDCTFKNLLAVFNMVKMHVYLYQLQEMHKK